MRRDLTVQLFLDIRERLEIGSASGSNATKSFADHAKRLQRDGIVTHRGPSKSSKQPRKPIYGKLQNSKVRSVKTFRTIDVFVSRLHPETTTAEIVDCVNDVKGDLIVSDVECTCLKSRYEHLYCSLHVAIKVDTANFQEALDLFMSPNSWPSGTLVKRYFKPKNG